jgi:hypothetical protein
VEQNGHNSNGNGHTNGKGNGVVTEEPKTGLGACGTPPPVHTRFGQPGGNIRSWEKPKPITGAIQAILEHGPSAGARIKAHIPETTWKVACALLDAALEPGKDRVNALRLLTEHVDGRPPLRTETTAHVVTEEKIRFEDIPEDVKLPSRN